ncbi:MAG: DUF4349 domain-containing protein [Solirubrobacterales bacterium]
MRLTDEQIGAELHALRELPSQGFAASLDRRVAAGFPAAKKADRELTWGRLLPALGALVAIAVVVVAISNSGNSYQHTDAGGPAVAPSAGAPTTGTAAAPKAGVELFGDQIAAGPSPAPPIPGSRPRNGRPQVQERTAELGLATDADKLQDAAGGVVNVTDSYDGFIDSSNVHTGGSDGRASFQLRIPTQHLQDALSDLSDLGRVTLLNQGSSNVTGSYVDAGKAYRDARATVDSLLARLNAASSPAEAANIKQQIGVAREQLAAARAGLRAIKGRVAYTPVSVEITAQGDGNWSIGDAADDATGVLEAIGGATLITLAVLIPLGVLSALIWFGARAAQRRRREASLER